jgi:N-acetylglucosamine kinase-like BadF-type ATPase
LGNRHRTFIVLGVDGGQSSTLALVAAPNGEILGTGLAGPANHIHEPGGPQRLERALSQAVAHALQNADCDPAQVRYACLGMTGGAEFARQIVLRSLPNAQVVAYDDMVTALAGGSIAKAGVVVVAGTGSVAYGRLDDGREARAGGWGYLIGDEGSAYDLARRALQAASHAVDGRGQATMLVKAIPQYFQLSTFADVRDVVYTPAVTRSRIAGLARVVAEEAKQGDAICISLLAGAGRALAHMALAVIARLQQTEAGMNIYLSGGVFQAADLVIRPLRETLQASSPASHVQKARYSSAVGALFLALRVAGLSLDDDVLKRLEASMPNVALSKETEGNTES